MDPITSTITCQVVCDQSGIGSIPVDTEALHGRGYSFTRTLPGLGLRLLVDPGTQLIVVDAAGSITFREITRPQIWARARGRMGADDDGKLTWGAGGFAVALWADAIPDGTAPDEKIRVVGLRCRTYADRPGASVPEPVDWIFCIHWKADPQKWERPVTYIGTTQDGQWTVEGLVASMLKVYPPDWS